MMSDISQAAYNRLKQKGVRPKPRWKFLMKSSLMWVTLGISIVVGSFAIAVILFQISNTDFDIHRNLNRGFWAHLFLTLPYIWFAIVGAFLFLAVCNFKHTKSGYRHQYFLIWLISISASFVIGGFLHMAGWGAKMDHALSQVLPFYQDLDLRRQKMWQNPGAGILAGRVEEIIDENTLIIRGPMGEEWEVKLASQFPIKDLGVFEGSIVGFIGQVGGGELIFVAEDARRLEVGPGRAPVPPRYFFERGPHSPRISE